MRKEYLRRFILLMVTSEYIVNPNTNPSDVYHNVCDTMLEPLDEYYKQALDVTDGQLTFDELDTLVKIIEDEIIECSSKI